MATEIAKAYVQIVPTTKGIKGKLEEELGGPAKSAGESAGSDAGEGLVSKLKGIVAAAGIGAVIKKALDAGGAVQQSFGGLDTLYGEASEAAKQYAREAAAAGISMNDYAEQAVSFGASLKSAFEGDVTKAAEAANTAIMDMADNSAKMGTDIGAVQSAYQGFAKQNYTMLDNLKLGYGGTKTEMERLLADAEKLSGVEYDIDNLGDVYAAIHVIQEDLGLTGVAAEEASSTFTGSFGAMKAAGENFLASLTLGQGVGESLTQLINSGITFVTGNLVPMLVNLAKAIPEVLSTLITQYVPKLYDAGKDMLFSVIKGVNGNYSSIVKSASDTISGFIKKIVAELPNIVTQGRLVVQSLYNGLINNLPAVLSGAAEIIVTLVDGLLKDMPKILQQGWELVKSLVNGVKEKLPEIGSTALDLIVKLASSLLENLPKILDTGIKILTELLLGIVNAIPKIPGTISQVISSIKAKFSEVDWGELGKNLIDGLVSGLTNAAGKLYEAVKNLIKNALTKGKEEAEVHSPSRKWNRELGQMLGLGTAEGLEESSNVVDKAVNDMMAGALITGKTDISGVASVTTSGLSSAQNDSTSDLLYRLVQIALDIDNTMEEKTAKALGDGVGLNISGREFGRLVKSYA